MRNRSLAAALSGVLIVATLSYANAERRTMNPARAAAIHECSVLAGRYPETTFGNTEFQLYRACMMQRGQPVE
ncbi:hypothetical protein [Pseudorhodoplanes sp.]|uniref:hypothetical protein n=1 Tax=Pseudorhodoplanes sp. TaxID=1934341 RepID=UPI00391BBCC1